VEQTIAITQDQAAYEGLRFNFDNSSSGYTIRSFRVNLLTPQTTYNFYTYVTNVTVTERFTAIVFRQVRTA